MFFYFSHSLARLCRAAAEVFWLGLARIALQLRLKKCLDVGRKELQGEGFAGLLTLKPLLTISIWSPRRLFLSDICSFGLDFKPRGKQD